MYEIYRAIIVMSSSLNMIMCCQTSAIVSKYQHVRQDELGERINIDDCGEYTELWKEDVKVES